jgi:hypothetical protein
VHEAGFEGHGQPRLAQRQPIRIELAGGVAALREAHGGETAGLMEVVVDVVGFEGHVESAVARLATQSALDIAHER